VSLSKDVVLKALDMVKSDHNMAEAKHAHDLEVAYKDNAELEQIDNSIIKIGSQLAIIALSGNTQKLEELKKQSNELTGIKKSILKHSGIPATPVYKCKKCNDTGYVDGKLCDCVQKVAKRLSYEQLCSQMPLKESTFLNFDILYYSNTADITGDVPKEVMLGTLNACKDFAKSFPSGKNLLFMGACGLGKTHLSLAIANEVLNRGYGVIYGSAQNLLNDACKESFDYNSGTEILDNLTSCDLLILDDLGSEFSTQPTKAMVYNIINTRLMNGFSTIINTNLSLKEIETIYSSRVSSRIMGNYTMRLFIGSDIRLIKAMQK